MLATCMMSLMYRRNNVYVAYYSKALPQMLFDKQYLFEKAFSKSKKIFHYSFLASFYQSIFKTKLILIQ